MDVKLAARLPAVSRGDDRPKDPAEAVHPTMPQAALDATQPDFVLPLAGLRSLLHTVVR